jgi:hypothetical protein
VRIDIPGIELLSKIELARGAWSVAHAAGEDVGDQLAQQVAHEAVRFRGVGREPDGAFGGLESRQCGALDALCVVDGIEGLAEPGV